MFDAKPFVRTDRWSDQIAPPLGLIDGQWVAADSGLTFPVVDPASGAVLAEVPRMGRPESRRAVEAADRAWGPWRQTSAQQRAAVLKEWARLMLDADAELAELMVREQGKPLSEALIEVRYAASFLEWFAEEGKRAYGETVPAESAGKRISVLKQPIGVGAAITPWNFPAAMITRKAAPALAAGCTLVIKPAEQTPLSAIAICMLAEEAGVPGGVLNLVLGDGEDAADIGMELTTHNDVRKISFTGSTEVGRLLMKQSSSTVKSVALELGGNAPFIVFEDADLEQAVAGLIACKYRNAGQTCISANRILIAATVHDRFVKMLTDQVRSLQVGSGMAPGVDVGPMIDSDAVKKVMLHISDAEKQGGKLVVGGAPHALGGNFFEPTLITNVAPTALAFQEETFGPVAFVRAFENESNAVEIANDTPYGLASYFYTQDVDRVWRVTEALDYGMVGVNTGILSTAVAPFGGVKQSGLGREGSRHGLDDWLELKYVTQDVRSAS